MARFDLTDFEWSVIQPLLPQKSRGVPRVDDRRVLNGIFWRLRTGAPWADIPARYGPHTTCVNRFNRWRRAGIWTKNTDAKTLQKFVADTAAQGATVYTDDAAAYKGMPFDHASVRHSVGEYVAGMAHTNACSRGRTRERSTRSAALRCGRHNMRDSDTKDQMQSIVADAFG